MRIVFLGTPDFALPSLQRLFNGGQEIVGVFSQPDRPKGRRMELEPTPVKALAQKLSLPVFQFEKIRSNEGQRALEELAPELMVTAAFGQILSQKNLDVPKHGCINVHASLLPKYRGAAPIQWAIIEGERVSGVTTMQTDAGLDTGDILLQRETPIGEQETAGELFERLSALGADLLMETIEKLEAGTLSRRAQDEKQATHFPMLKKEDGKLDFARDAQSLVNLVRGTNPWPVAHALLDGEPLKVYRARVFDGAGLAGAAGQVVGVTKEGIVVRAGSGVIELLEVQPQGKKRMSAVDFARGRQGLSGARLT